MSKQTHAQNDDVQKHTPVEPWGQKSMQKYGIQVGFGLPNEASLWRLARSFPVYGWEKCGRKIFEMSMQKGTPNEAVQKRISVEPWDKKSGKNVEFSQTISLKRGVTVTLGLQVPRVRMEKNVLAKQCTNCTLF